MSFAGEWDHRKGMTLRFAESWLERAYQVETTPVALRQLRTACSLAAIAWVVNAIIAPRVLSVDEGPIYVVSLSMVAVLVAAYMLAATATIRRQLEVIGILIQGAAAIAVLALAAVTDQFVPYAAGGLMVVMVIGYGLQRHPFVLAVPLGAFQVASFVVFGIALDMGPVLVFQTFLVGTVMIASSAGLYLLEDAQRSVYAQRTLIADLHRRVDALFHQYMSPDVAESLLAAPERANLGGEVAEVTVLLADLRDFTPFSETISPAEVVGMLNTVYSAAVPVIFAEGGTVIQFVGDSVMAIFNAPIRQPDHALRAARAALGMQRAVSAIPGSADRPGFRVGLNTGPALVGNIGSPQLRNFTAIGDTTNLAARLQTFAEVGSVVISEETYRLIDSVAAVRALGSPELKGRSESVPVYELLSLTGDASLAEHEGVSR